MPFLTSISVVDKVVFQYRKICKTFYFAAIYHHMINWSCLSINKLEPLDTNGNRIEDRAMSK